MPTSVSSNRKLLIGFAAALAAAAALSLASGAQARLVEAAPDCAAESLTEPFAPWLDEMNYQFAPDGGFEAGGEGWDLSGDAESASGNESYYVHDANDSRSLALPAGSSAKSPTICVGLEHPTVRFFAKRTRGFLATMLVEVRFALSSGDVVSTPIGVVAPTSTWQPTLPMPVVASLLPLLPGDHTPVQFRITALSGDWKIDDFYVDPTRKN